MHRWSYTITEIILLTLHDQTVRCMLGKEKLDHAIIYIYFTLSFKNYQYVVFLKN